MTAFQGTCRQPLPKVGLAPGPPSDLRRGRYHWGQPASPRPLRDTSVFCVDSGGVAMSLQGPGEGSWEAARGGYEK